MSLRAGNKVTIGISKTRKLQHAHFPLKYPIWIEVGRSKQDPQKGAIKTVPSRGAWRIAESHKCTIVSGGGGAGAPPPSISNKKINVYMQEKLYLHLHPDKIQTCFTTNALGFKTVGSNCI